MRVVDADGKPPTIPFWTGEAPARTAELSHEVSELRATLDGYLAVGDADGARAWLARPAPLDDAAVDQIVDYVAAGRAVLGVVPTHDDLVFERFFDDAEGMHLVVHSPYGGRVNRALGLALRKRFCVSFDFELQAAANDDAVVLSLGPHHSFPLADVPRFLNSNTVRGVLEQAVLSPPSPMFQSRWRWNLNRSLVVLRFKGGRRNPPPIQRMESDDMMAALFPQAAACQENVAGPVEIPDHPIVRQTMHDTMTEGLDIDGLTELLDGIETGRVQVHFRDTTEASAFSHEILTAKPYAFLDDAELQDRRTNAVPLRRGLPVDLGTIGRLDPDAIDRVARRGGARPPHARRAARPAARAGRHPGARGLAAAVRPAGGPRAGAAGGAVDHRAAARRAVVGHRERRPGRGRRRRRARRRPPPRAGGGRGAARPPRPVRARSRRRRWPSARASTRRRSPWAWPCSRTTGSSSRATSPCPAIRPTAPSPARRRPRRTVEWCARRLLARMHSYSRKSRRKAVEAVTAQDFMRFLLRWQHVAPGTQVRGHHGVRAVVEQLQGYEAAVAAWEPEILARRVEGYRPGMLDRLCHDGEVTWLRLSAAQPAGDRKASPSKATPVALAFRDDLTWLLQAARQGGEPEAARAGGDRRGGRGPAGARRLLPVRAGRGHRPAGHRPRVRACGTAWPGACSRPTGSPPSGRWSRAAPAARRRPPGR